MCFAATMEHSVLECGSILEEQLLLSTSVPPPDIFHLLLLLLLLRVSCRETRLGWVGCVCVCVVVVGGWGGGGLKWREPCDAARGSLVGWQGEMRSG